MQQQQGGSNNSGFMFSMNGGSGPTSAAAHWLNEKCEKSVAGNVGVVEIKPIAFGF